MHIFRKNIPKSFGSSEKSSTFALAFEKYLANEVTQGKKKEFFEKIYIKQKVVVQEASEKSLG